MLVIVESNHAHIMMFKRFTYEMASKIESKMAAKVVIFPYNILKLL